MRFIFFIFEPRFRKRDQLEPHAALDHSPSPLNPHSRRRKEKRPQPAFCPRQRPTLTHTTAAVRPPSAARPSTASRFLSRSLSFSHSSLSLLMCFSPAVTGRRLRRRYHLCRETQLAVDHQ